ncbi:hypothetical protein [Sphingobacterium rhinopitheci]|uniref:hypothetical protein n=1 Tax=Sphingobacterium rhinopitheci TaxID=2781960 RepID=UPI001F515DB0|nr:hypothetical protein [Sphingobacterium rhinopitheci]MCI0921530.1 hypothetical protein [Sphingobacterium rhinopitheci]
MKNIASLAIAFVALIFTTNAQQAKQILPADLQIKIATQAAPAEFRAEAKVYGYDQNGKLVTLREGKNGYICLAPDYKMSMYYAYCYPESLEPFMARGRELTEQGKRKERDKIREQEFKDGKLSIPQTPTTLYGYWGNSQNVDATTGEIKDAKRRYVIYIPYAKAADLGLSNKSNNIGMPWLMDEGSYKAHIMITPPLDDHKH